MLHPTVCRLLVCLGLLVMGVAPARPAYAAGVVGDGTPGSCTEAAFTTALAGGGTLTFNCGGPATILLTSEKVLTVDTVIDGGNAITLTGGLATRLISTATAAPPALELRNLTLDSAYSNNASGAAVRAFGSLVMSGVTVQNSLVAPNFCGGAVLVSGPALIEDSVFQNNTAPLGGGAVCFRTAADQAVLVRDTLFYNNLATDAASGFGGALFLDNASRVNVVNSIFLSNRAHFGGAAYVGASAALTLHGTTTDSIFSSGLQLNANSSTEDGGALYNAGGALAIDGALITTNQTPTQTVLAGYGGAIFSSGVLTLTRSHLSQNQGRFGGALFVGGEGAARATLDHVTFKLNTAGSLGGGLYANSETTNLTITNTLFYSNVSEGGGGGLARFNAGLRVADSAFVDNRAVSGGGLSLAAGPSPTSGPYVRLENVTVSGNNATGGQGGGVHNTGRAELYSVTIKDNAGGGTYTALGGNTRFRSAVVTNASAVNCDGDGSGQISNDGGNHITDTTCGPQFTTVGTNPMLGPIGIDPVSGTYYHAPLAGSPLINVGFNCTPRDQLGALRPDACDIGAVEAGGLLPRVYLSLMSR